MITPNFAAMDEIMQIVESNSKSKGATLKGKTFKDMKALLVSKYGYKDLEATYDTLFKHPKSALENITNIINSEYEKEKNKIDSDVANSSEWMDKIFEILTKTVTSAINMLMKIVYQVYDITTHSMPSWLVSLIVATIFFGVWGSLVIISMSIWFVVTENHFWDGFNYYDLAKKRVVSWFDKTDDAPATIKPPEPEIPNFSDIFNKKFVIKKEPSNIKESAGGLEFVGVLLFMLFMKASIAYEFNKEIIKKTPILLSLLTPITLLFTIMTGMILLSNGGLAEVNSNI